MNLWDVTEKLTHLESNEPTHWANLTTASQNNLPFSALHYARHFLTAWSDHEYADQVREIRDIAQTIAEKILASDSTTQGHHRKT
jgi:hypothetical protein